MTRDIAISLARRELANKSIRDLDLLRHAREQRAGRNIWLVVFVRREEPGVVVSPDTVFVEVDEETQIANILLDP